MQVVFIYYVETFYRDNGHKNTFKIHLTVFFYLKQKSNLQKR